ncbi:MAG: hypothetical protein P4L16_05730 [Chlamydiales bacterium]|nr:hypothetical protein [Chlamydiales bacterium]
MSINLTAQLFSGHAPQLTLKNHHIKSAGSYTRRIEFCLFNNHPQNSNNPHYKIACLAIKELSAKDAALLPSEVTLGFFEKFFWKPISIQTVTGEHKTILVNINSAIKRLGVLGFTSSQVQQALNANSLGDLLISTKAQKIKDSAEQYGCTINSSLMQELKNALIHIQQIKPQLNGDQSFKFSSNIKIEFIASTHKIKLTINDQYNFDFDLGDMPILDKKYEEINDALDLLLDEDSLKELLQKIQEKRDSWKKAGVDYTYEHSYGTSLSFNARDDKITLCIEGQYIDYDSGQLISYAASKQFKLTDCNIKAIYDYIDDNVEPLHLFENTRKFVTMPIGDHNSEERFIIISAEGDIFVFLDDTNKGRSVTLNHEKRVINLITGDILDALIIDTAQDPNNINLDQQIQAYKKSRGKPDSEQPILETSRTFKNKAKYSYVLFNQPCCGLPNS